MPLFTDQTGNRIILHSAASKIISLVPSQTELLYHLGLDKEVVGITKFCIHPEHWFKSKTRVGGTKTVNIEKIRSLQPGLIIANKEENVKEQIEILQQIAPVWVSNVNNLDDALQMIQRIGKMVDKADKVDELIKLIKESFEDIATPFTVSTHQLSAAYLIWKEPYMTVGGNTFINDMMQRAGFNNVFSHLRRYPKITTKELASSDCTVVLLSSEPYPFRQKHAAELQSILPDKKVILADGKMFSWYGSRLQQAPAYFQKLHRAIK